MTRLALFLLTLSASAAVHEIRPGDNPQAVADRAQPGDRLVFLPGMHVHPLRKHSSLLYIDRKLDIELQPGAVLKLADKQTLLRKDPELTTDHGAPKSFDDIHIGGDYDLGLGPVLFNIRIDSQGSGSTPDTFTWGYGDTFNVRQTKVPISGSWQRLTNGVEIKFDRTIGHTVGSLWFISYDGPESYGIRIGYGTQKDYIDGVRIFGKGEIDLNLENNVQPSQMVKNISACVLVHGRVRNVDIEEITMRNAMRSVMLYGEHTGKFLQGGATEGGESFDAENISIFHTRTINPADKAYLLGHPSHRGRLSKVRCNFNYMETGTTALEPNFNLDQYEVIGNVIKSGGRAIHCWRKSTNGLIAHNVRIDDPSGKEVVMVNAPGAWQNPENIILRDNRNHLTDRLGFWANVAGGLENQALGRFSAVIGGTRNEASADYSAASGFGARASRPGEFTLASGAFQSPGDAQSGVLVAKALTTNNSPTPLQLASNSPIAVAASSSLTYRILVQARSEGGRDFAAFEATGIATRGADGALSLRGNKVSPIDRSHPQLQLDVLAGSQTLDLRARGLDGVTMRWAARIELVEVRF